MGGMTEDPSRASLGPEDRRKTERFAVEMPVEVSMPLGKANAGIATNVSTSGFRMTSTAPLKPGQKVRVRLKGGLKRLAIVRWVDGDQAGLRFVQILPEYMISLLTGR